MERMTIHAEMLADMFRQGTYELNRNKEGVDALNVFPVPDGDTGTNMSLTMNSAIESLDAIRAESVEDVAKAVSKGSLMGARGNSGVILSQIFRGFAKGCKDKRVLNSADVCHAIKDASDSAYSAVLKPVEGTILTVIRKIAEKAMEYADERVDIIELLGILIKKGEETLEKTPEYLPVLKQAGVVDAGGKGLIFILKGCLDALQGKTSYQQGVGSVSQAAAHRPAQAVMETGDITFSYCTEFIIEGENMDGPALKRVVETMGDSMVFVQDDELIKVHVHTNTPGLALEEALKHGALKKVKIENMRDQHSSIVGAHGVIKGTAEQEVPLEQDLHQALSHEDEYGFIAVAMGDGFQSIFKDLGIHGIIAGGQTMNPSTQDFLEAIDACPSKHIFLFPNNSNIIMAANQAKDISERDVYVVPTKTMPQCIAAMLTLDRDAAPEETHAAMLEGLTMVKTIQVTYAVRDTVFNDLPIEKGDYLAISGGDINGAGKEMDAVVLEALELQIDEDSEIVSLYYGTDIDEASAQALADQVRAQYPDVEVDVYYGGQPVYYYVVSIE